MGLGKKKHIDILDLKTVLILDKDIGSLKLLQIYVENLGAHHVLAVQDLAEAWLYVNTKKIDLVVTDWKFIDSNGLTFYERIRSSPKMQKMPIILVSGFVTKNEIETTKKDSKMRFLVKPFPQDLFFGCVHQLFKFNPPDKGTKDLARNKSHQNKLDVTPHGMEKPTRQSNVIVLKGDGRFADRGIEIHKGHGVDRGLGIEVHEGPGSISGRGTIVEPGEQVDRSLGIDVQKYNQSGGGQNVIVDGNDESKPGFDIKVQDSQYRGWGLDVNQERLSPKANDLIQSELGADGGTATATSPFKAISADDSRPGGGRDLRHGGGRRGVWRRQAADRGEHVRQHDQVHRGGGAASRRGGLRGARLPCHGNWRTGDGVAHRQRHGGRRARHHDDGTRRRAGGRRAHGRPGPARRRGAARRAGGGRPGLPRHGEFWRATDGAGEVRGPLVLHPQSAGHADADDAGGVC